jgi:hypothetical protein
MSTNTTFTPEQVKPLLEPLVSKIAERQKRLSAELAADHEEKNAANVLCRMAGMAEMYKLDGTVDGAPKPPPAPLKFKMDQFVNMDLSVAVAEYLEARKASGTVEGPASIDDIYEGLLSGGYKFGGSTENPANHKRAMNIALTRNTAQMHKINENTFGLRRWYGMRAPRKTTTSSKEGNENPAGAPEPIAGDEAETPSPGKPGADKI